MATDVRTLRSAARARLATRASIPDWPAAAWGAIFACAAFIAITCWWLTQDRTIPIYDSGFHLTFAFNVHAALSAGELGRASEVTFPYPPLTYLIGTLGIVIGGVGVAPPILAENLVFVPLLALGCYQLGRLAFGPLAGLLAVVFALGSPLIIPQFHVFMTDAPETAMVAVSVWLIIATEGFSRLRFSILAGLAVGFGLLIKEPFAFFVAGPLVVASVRGAVAIRAGNRGVWRGLIAFAAVALVIALPWYISEYSRLHALGETTIAAANHSNEAGAGSVYEQDIAPARFSLDNLEWYLWNFVNFQLYLPLFLFAAAGWIWMVVQALRRRPVSPFAPELLVGAFVAWFALTETFVHDTRYSMPMLVYLAVIGTGWIVYLSRPVRLAAAAVLALVAIANTLATSFGVGDTVLAANGPVSAQGHATTLQHSGQIVVYSNGGFQVAGPKRDGNMLGMLQALRRAGVLGVTWNVYQAQEPDFSEVGVNALLYVADLKSLVGIGETELTSHDAIFAHEAIKPAEPPPCVTLDDGTGVWVRLGNPKAHGARDYCPLPKPHLYGPAEP